MQETIERLAKKLFPNIKIKLKKLWMRTKCFLVIIFVELDGSDIVACYTIGFQIEIYLGKE
ncbi:MAG: hypothetical protein GX289_12185 [Tissierellia bacterium]|nr:hypothetical protein [Tissierellia bacterium]